MRSRVVLLILTSALALVLGLWSFSPHAAVEVVSKGGYWIILVAALLLVIALSRSLKSEVRELRAIHGWWLPACVVIGAAGFLHLHESHEFKIVADEVVLGLTAKQMHFVREASVTVRGYEYAGNYTSFVTYVDKRPLFFPFLLATVHDFTGFRVNNVFVLNGALTLGLTGLLMLIGRRLGGWGAGIVTVLLVSTIPLVAQNACGAGFELLNMVMILLTLWLGLRAAECCEDNDRLSAFVLSGVLLTQVRYESVLFVLPVAGTVAYLWWRQRAIRLPWPVLAAPLVMVLSPLQYNVFKLSKATWQLNDIAGADQPFGFKYFYDNVGHALNFFLTLDGSQPNSILVGVGGVLAVGFFVLLLYRRSRALFSDEPEQAVMAIFLLGLLVHTALMLCYFWGRWDDPIIRRLSLPAHLLLVFAMVVVWPHFLGHARRWQILGSVAFFYLLSCTVPSNAMHRFTQQNFAARTANWVDGHVRTLGDRTAVAIDRNAGLIWILHGKSSVTSQAIVGRPEAFALHFRNHSFQEYFLIQRLTPDVKTGARIVDGGDDFGEAFTLETIEEHAFAPLYLVRLSRIVGVDETKLIAWAKDRQGKKLVELPAGTTLGPAQEDQLLLWLRQLP
ncbi:MAG: glycosyltransferase family 39 protein [Opitutus sp.]